MRPADPLYILRQSIVLLNQSDNMPKGFERCCQAMRGTNLERVIPDVHAAENSGHHERRLTILASLYGADKRVRPAPIGLDFVCVDRQPFLMRKQWQTNLSAELDQFMTFRRQIIQL